MQIKDIFDIDKTVAEHGNKIFLIGGVGSGKSSWVTEVLAQKGSVLWVTSRKAKVTEDIQCSCFSDIFRWHTNNNQTLITNAKLERVIERISNDYMRDLNEFLDHFDYVVVDEVHSVVADSTYAGCCAAVLSFIDYVAESGKTIVCMTGTSEPIQQHFEANGWYTIDYTKACEYVHPKRVSIIQGHSVIQYISSHSKTQQIVYFANHLDGIMELCKELLDKEILSANEIAISVSSGREEGFFSELRGKLAREEDADVVIESSRDAYGEIIDKKRLPINCKILLSSSVLKEGINIQNENMVVFCEAHLLSDLIQFFGRVRQGAVDVYVISDSQGYSLNNHSPLLYNYAISDEVAAANSFYSSAIDSESTLFPLVDKAHLAAHVTKNPYIYFDYIKGAFRVFHEKYNEELRLMNNADWRKKLESHCEHYRIEQRWFDAEKTTRSILTDLAKRNTCFYGSKAIQTLQHCLITAYHITKKQPKGINKQLEKENAPIRLSSGKGTSGQYRDIRFWALSFVEPELAS